MAPRFPFGVIVEVPGVGGRIIKLLCINDDEVRPIRDLGIDRQGTPTGQRQMLYRMLNATTSASDGRTIATFALAEPPTKQWSANDPLDRLLRDFNGAWQKPGPEWMAERQKRIDANKAKLAGLESTLRESAQAALADQMGKMMASAAKGKNA
jgi:hypothetical protein